MISKESTNGNHFYCTLHFSYETKMIMHTYVWVKCVGYSIAIRTPHYNTKNKRKAEKNMNKKRIPLHKMNRKTDRI